MMSSEYIIDVSEADFQQQVLVYSNKTPVVVDFWAEWCKPCQMLGPILEKLTHEARGAFRLAKVNVDENPNLAVQYQVHGIPAVKAFRSGQVVAEFSGAQSEIQVREFLRTLAPGPGDLNLEKGHSLFENGDWTNATSSFRQVLESDPDNSAALLGLAKSLILQDKNPDALVILRAFPASKQYSAAEKLLPLAEAIANQEVDSPSDGEGEEPLEAAYSHALRLVSRGNTPAAIDGLLDILREDKTFRDGNIQKLILALLELLGEENPQTRSYRSELASLLF